jgi:hypothetical protein
VPRPGDPAFHFEGSVASSLLPGLTLPTSSRVVASSDLGRVLTDDLNPIDQLQSRSLEQARERMAQDR